VLLWTLGLPAADVLDDVRARHGENNPTLTDLAAAEPSADHSAFEFGLARPRTAHQFLA
jgi:hypothetical protein